MTSVFGYKNSFGFLFQNYHLENEKYLKIPESFPQKNPACENRKFV